MKHFRIFGPTAILAGILGAAALAPVPVQAQSSDEIVRTLVQVADVIFRNGQPYYRYGSNEPLAVGRDQYGRTVYYRTQGYGQYPYAYPQMESNTYGRTVYYGTQDYQGYPPYGSTSIRNSTTRCNSSGWCTQTYYDPRYDRSRRGQYYRFP